MKVEEPLNYRYECVVEGLLTSSPPVWVGPVVVPSIITWVLMFANDYRLPDSLMQLKTMISVIAIIGHS